LAALPVKDYMAHLNTRESMVRVNADRQANAQQMEALRQKR
jgi:hypothetical protein